MKQATILTGAFLFVVSRLFATFHLWEINEVYSSSDGSVQFIELFTTADGQEFLSGQSLTVTGVGAAAPFTFGANVSRSATANHSLLIGTSNLETLYGLVRSARKSASGLAAGSRSRPEISRGPAMTSASISPPVAVRRT